MRISFVPLALLFTATIASGQAWKWQNPLPNGNQLTSVSWIDPNIAWTVGSLGNALQTTNGGATWGSRSVSSGATLSRIIFSSPSSGWAFGPTTTLHTTDSGATWAPADLGQGPNALNDAAFIGPLMGWAVGINGTIVRTSNGGATWEIQTSGTAQSLTGVSFINASTGYACGNSGTILKTTDGGGTWSKKTVNTTAWLRDIAAVDEFNATVVGDGGRILTTTDRGVTWVTRSSQTARNLMSVGFFDFFHGVTVGDGGTVRQTEDGGLTWNFILGGTGENLQSVHYANVNRWAAVGNACQIITSDDMGRTWTLRTQGPTTEFLDVDFVDSLYGWAVGRNGLIVRTIDGGSTWLNASTQTFHNINGVSFVNRTTGWAVGDTAYIVRTTNGGLTWGTENLPITTKMNLYGVKFTDANFGWTCGSNGTYLFHTTNGGVSWITSYTQITGNVTLRRLSVNAASVCAVGTSGTIYHTFDGGTTWRKQPSGTTQTLNGISFPTMTHGVAVGNGGTILSTTDGGATWTQITSGTGANLMTVILRSDSSARICGASGSLLRSTDAGASWLFAQPQPTLNDINSIVAPTARTAFAVGQFGTILKSYQPQSALSTSRRAVHFDSIEVQTCDSAVVNVVNVGDDSVRITAATLIGADTADFSIASGNVLPVTLQHNQTIAFTVRYCPHSPRFSAVSLVLNNTSPSSSLTMAVDGFAGALGFRGVDTLNFRHVAAGDQFDTSGFIVNTGSIPLRLKSLVIHGPDSSRFVFNGTFAPMSIPPGDSIELRFIFIPTDANPRSATALITTNSRNSVTIFLHGNDQPSAVYSDNELLMPGTSLMVAPLPLYDQGTITLQGSDAGPALLSLADMFGRPVWERRITLSSSGNVIPLHAPDRSGLYMLSLRGTHGMRAYPIVVLH